MNFLTKNLNKKNFFFWGGGEGDAFAFVWGGEREVR